MRVPKLKAHMEFARPETHLTHLLPCVVLGIPHPAVNTRDIALYQPFKNTLRGSANQVIGLQTLMWHLMRRRVQDGKIDAVSAFTFSRWVSLLNGSFAGR